MPAANATPVVPRRMRSPIPSPSLSERSVSPDRPVMPLWVAVKARPPRACCTIVPLLAPSVIALPVTARLPVVAGPFRLTSPPAFTVASPPMARVVSATASVLVIASDPAVIEGRVVRPPVVTVTARDALISGAAKEVALVTVTSPVILPAPAVSPPLTVIPPVVPVLVRVIAFVASARVSSRSPLLAVRATSLPVTVPSVSAAPFARTRLAAARMGEVISPPASMAIPPPVLVPVPITASVAALSVASPLIWKSAIWSGPLRLVAWSVPPRTVVRSTMPALTMVAAARRSPILTVPAVAVAVASPDTVTRAAVMSPPVASRVVVPASSVERSIEPAVSFARLPADTGPASIDPATVASIS